MSGLFGDTPEPATDRRTVRQRHAAEIEAACVNVVDETVRELVERISLDVRVDRGIASNDLVELRAALMASASVSNMADPAWDAIVVVDRVVGERKGP